MAFLRFSSGDDDQTYETYQTFCLIPSLYFGVKILIKYLGCLNLTKNHSFSRVNKKKK